MRRYLLALFACLTVFLMAVTPAFTIVPTVIVYPLAASSSTLDREVSARIATILATQIAQGDKIKIVPPKAGVDRADYLADARSVGANYYVTGFITPLGNGATVVEQVVSTVSGTLVFSVSNYVSNLADVTSQGDQLREGILDRGTRALQAFQAPPPPESTPAPQASNGADVNVNKLFGHKKNSGPAAVAAWPPKDATVAILTIGGSADSEARTAAADGIAAAFVHEGRHAVIVSANVPSNDICTANKATSLIAAWLDTPAGNPNAALRMIAYDCSGKVAYDRTFQLPLAGVTGAAVDAYLNPAKTRG